MSEQFYIKIHDGIPDGNPIAYTNLKQLYNNKEFSNGFLKSNGYAVANIIKEENILPWEILVENDWTISEDLLYAEKTFSKKVIDIADVNEDLLNSFKSFLLSQLNNIRYTKEISGFPDSNGNKIDTSRESQLKLTITQLNLSNGSMVEPILWKCQGDIWVEYTSAEFNSLVSAITENIQKVYKCEMLVKNIIDSYTTLEEITSCKLDELFDNTFSTI